MAESPGSSAIRDSPKSARNHVHLHFVSPSPENELTLSDVDVEITIGTLLERISQRLPRQPSPDSVRLIYQGRPLIDRRSTLRSYLQRELESQNCPEILKIHLVISSASSAPNNPVGDGIPHGLPPLPQLPPQLSQQRLPPLGQPGLPNPQGHVHIHQIHGANQPHMHLPPHLLHNQLQAVQQQLQQMGHMPPAAGHQIPSIFGGMPPMVPGAPPPPQQALPNFQALIAQQQQQRAMAGFHGMPFQLPGQAGATPGPHSGHQDGAANATNLGNPPHRQTTVQDMIGPNGQRVRVTTAVESVVISRGGTPQPGTANDQPANASEHTSMENSSSGQMRPSSLSPPMNLNTHNHPALPAMPTITPVMPFIPSLPSLRHSISASAPSGTTTAWLMSSPSGPQAILFSPDHGTYYSQPPPTRTQTVVPTTQPNTNSPPAGTGAHAEPPAQQRFAQPARIIRPGRGDVQPNQDLLALALSRIWLFIRLYLFALIFTEPSSWFRWAVITGAVLFCCSPPNNFFQGQFRRLQGHLENLVPLAAPANARQQGNNDANALGRGDRAAPGARGRRGREPDPHEAAERLLRQHNEQNNSWLMETSRRIERALALFIASLVPGVGERHIRARNEAEAARQEAERQTQREQEAEGESQQARESEAQGGNNNSISSDNNTASSSAVAIQGSDDNSRDGLMQRSGGEDTTIAGDNDPVVVDEGGCEGNQDAPPLIQV